MKLRNIKNKKAQIMGVPFQLIFSLIIVAVVLVFGFFAIKMFLNRAEQSRFGVAFNDVQEAVYNAYSSGGGSDNGIAVLVPKDITAICFLQTGMGHAKCTNPLDDPFGNMQYFCDELTGYAINDENFVFYPFGVAEKYNGNSARKLLCDNRPCLNITKNPQCFPKDSEGNINIKLQKNIGEQLVRLKSP